MKSPGASSQRKRDNEGKTEEIGVQEMLKRYQENYRKQKEDSIGQRRQPSLSPNSHSRRISGLGVSDVQHHQDSLTSSEGEYVNRSFISGSNIQKSPIYQAAAEVPILITTKQPFEFIDSQSSSLLKGHLTL